MVSRSTSNLDEEDVILTLEDIRLAAALRAEFLHFANYWDFYELANKDEDSNTLRCSGRQYRYPTDMSEEYRGRNARSWTRPFTPRAQMGRWSGQDERRHRPSPHRRRARRSCCTTLSRTLWGRPPKWFSLAHLTPPPPRRRRHRCGGFSQSVAIASVSRRGLEPRSAMTGFSPANTVLEFIKPDTQTIDNDDVLM